jgi:hypothetical protein
MYMFMSVYVHSCKSRTHVHKIVNSVIALCKNLYHNRSYWQIM